MRCLSTMQPPPILKQQHVRQFVSCSSSPVTGEMMRSTGDLAAEERASVDRALQGARGGKERALAEERIQVTVYTDVKVKQTAALILKIYIWMEEVYI